MRLFTQVGVTVLANCVSIVAAFYASDVQATGYTFTKIVDTTTASPSGPFQNIGSPAISGTTVAFRATYYDAGIPVHGIFTGTGGAPTTIVKTGDTAPSGTFSIIDDPAISGSTVAFRGNDDSGNFVIFTINGGQITTVVRMGDAAPVGTFSQLSGPTISGNTVAFQGSYRNQSFSFFGSGIFTGNGGPLTTIAKEGDISPSGHELRAFGDGPGATPPPAISGNRVAFYGGYSNGGGDIFSSTGGPLTGISMPADGLPPDTFFWFVSDGISISGSTVAFSGNMANSSGSQIGLFTGSGGPLTTIAIQDSGGPPGTITLIGDRSVSGNTVAFSAVYGVGSNWGIFTGNGGALTTVIKPGDPLFGSTVQSGLTVVADAGGSGNLAFTYTLADGRSGIAMAALAIEPPLPGDYNQDGTVDAADYVYWRRYNGTQDGFNEWRANFGRSSQQLAGDYNRDGTVDAADYVVWRKNDGTQAGFDTWRAHFGNTSSNGGNGGSSNVPEPATQLILVAFQSCIVLGRRLNH